MWALHPPCRWTLSEQSMLWKMGISLHSRHISYAWSPANYAVTTKSRVSKNTLLLQLRLREKPHFASSFGLILSTWHSWDCWKLSWQAQFWPTEIKYVNSYDYVCEASPLQKLNLLPNPLLCTKIWYIYIIRFSWKYNFLYGETMYI